MDNEVIAWSNVDPLPRLDRMRWAVAIGLVAFVLSFWAILIALIGLESAQETGLILSLSAGLAIVLAVGEAFWFVYARELNRSRIVRIGFDGNTLYLERGHGVESLPFTQIRSLKPLPSGRLRIERQAGWAYTTDDAVDEEIVARLREKVRSRQPS